MTDIIIIGAGAAGLTAAIYARRAAKSVLVLEALSYGGQIINTPAIENYPVAAHISGFDFATKVYEQAKELGAAFKFEKALSIRDNGSSKTVVTAKGEYEAGAVIIAKANMSEFAWSADESHSTLGGDAHNAYDTGRSPAGSSGGSATAAASNFAPVALGTA